MTEKRFKETISTGIITDNKTGIEYNCEMRIDDDFLNLVNTISEENEQLHHTIVENEKMIQSVYDELTKLRCIKKNLGRIKAQWDWIMEAIQYD